MCIHQKQYTMKDYYANLSKTIQRKLQKVDWEGCDISIEEALAMVKFFERCLCELRTHFLTQNDISNQDEIYFFKEVKPEVLGFLLYFNKINNIELKCPTGNSETLKCYYNEELQSLTYFFKRNLDFYQYYRAKANYLDDYYFIRRKAQHQRCRDSAHYIRDHSFSTGYDLKIAKIICNEMLRIYLNKKINGLERKEMLRNNRLKLLQKGMKWTGPKVTAIELGYALQASGDINNGNVDIKEIMLFLETSFDIDLGSYYRTYIAIKSRKKNRTPFLLRLIKSLTKKMDDDDK